MITTPESAPRIRDGLTRIVEWWESHCDGDREHMHGWKIWAFDNPGMGVEIELHGTPQSDLCVNESDRSEGEITIETHDFVLMGYCEPPSLLPELLNRMADKLSAP